ncbi:MAG: hypothetical protein XD64_1283, partial [Thermotoga sp. 47_83]
GALLGELLEEYSGEISRGSGMEGGIGPPGDKVFGSELLIHLSRKGTTLGVSMAMRLPGKCYLVVLRFSLGMGSLALVRTPCSGNPPRFPSFSQKTPGLEEFEDPFHSGGGNSETLSSEEDSELCLPQRGEFVPKSLNPFPKLRGPLRLPYLPGSSGSVLWAGPGWHRSLSSSWPGQ